MSLFTFIHPLAFAAIVIALTLGTAVAVSGHR